MLGEDTTGGAVSGGNPKEKLFLFLQWIIELPLFTNISYFFLLQTGECLSSDAPCENI